MFKNRGTLGLRIASLWLLVMIVTACGDTSSNAVLTPAALPALSPTVMPSPVPALPVYPPTEFGGTQVTATLDGSGSTFAGPIYSKWISDYQKVAPNVKINYQGTSSGNGRSAFLGTPIASITPAPTAPADFAGSDAPFKTSEMVELAKKGELVHVPIAIGGVAVVYHLDGYNNELLLSGPTLANIFLGTIKTWNDPAIAADNGLKTSDLPNKTIKVVIRTRGVGSGTTEIFTRYLSVVSADFRLNPGPGSAPAWPQLAQLEGSGNDEIANFITNTDGSIGYADLNAADAKKLKYASIRNLAGRFIKPDATTITAAAQGFSVPDDFRVFIVNAEGESAYPIAGFTWFITWQNLNQLPNPSPAKAQALANFMWWFIHSGQGDLPAGYAPLPPALIPRLEALFLNSDPAKVFQFDNKPVFTASK